jgi:hypothetical protein
MLAGVNPDEVKSAQRFFQQKGLTGRQRRTLGGERQGQEQTSQTHSTLHLFQTVRVYFRHSISIPRPQPILSVDRALTQRRFDRWWVERPDKISMRDCGPHYFIPARR